MNVTSVIVESIDEFGIMNVTVKIGLFIVNSIWKVHSYDHGINIFKKVVELEKDESYRFSLDLKNITKGQYKFEAIACSNLIIHNRPTNQILNCC